MKLRTGRMVSIGMLCLWLLVDGVFVLVATSQVSGQPPGLGEAQVTGMSVSQALAVLNLLMTLFGIAGAIAVNNYRLGRLEQDYRAVRKDIDLHLEATRKEGREEGRMQAKIEEHDRRLNGLDGRAP